jgi:predicted AlkP superfamily pyrophosphatase or phosphodiesterase
MKIIGLIVASCLTLFFVAGSRGEASASIPAKDRIVVLVTIDGFPSWIWREPTLPMPTLRKLAAEGAVAEAMTVSNPSITWINHTTLVTGVTPRKHGVLFNGLLIRQPPLAPVIEPWRDKAELVRVPTIYDLAHRAGLKTAQVDWVAILNSGTIDWEFLEVPKPEGIIERELIARGALSAADVAGFAKGKNIAWRDLMWTRAATHIVREHKPNLLLFHLLTTDAVNHAAGPGSQASYTAYGYVDRLLGDLLEAVREAGLKEKATILVTTDHGFKKVAKVMFPNVALRNAGLVQIDKEKVSRCDAYAMAQGGMAFLYINDSARRASLLPELRELFSKMEGVAQVVDGNDGPSFGMPLPSENAAMGDLVLFAKSGYAFKGAFEGEELVASSSNYLGTHGYVASDPDLDGVFIASGYGIRKGAHAGRIRNLDVAPTIAALLGIDLRGSEGEVLADFLSIAAAAK